MILSGVVRRVWSFSPQSDAPRAQRGASRELNFIIFQLCRFIPAYKAGLSRHLPVKKPDITTSSGAVEWWSLHILECGLRIWDCREGEVLNI